MCKNELCAGKINQTLTLAKVPLTPSNITQRYPWATQFKCDICHAVYYSCSICNSQSLETNMLIQSRLQRHDSLHVGCNSLCQSGKMLKRKHNKVENDMEQKVGNVINQDTFYENMSSDLFDRRETFNYYNFNELQGDGAAFLIANASCGTSNAYRFVETDDITLHLLIAKFVKTLSRIQRVEFALILEMLNHKLKDNLDETTKWKMPTISVYNGS